MASRKERRQVLAKLGKAGRKELELLKEIRTEDPAELERLAKEFEAKGQRVAAIGLRAAINVIQKKQQAES